MNTAPDKPLVFINYRRDDTGDVADHLRTLLAQQLPGFHIFLDRRIAIDTQWEAEINAAIDRCLVFVVLAGPKWASIKGNSGLPRLAEPNDYVRTEIERALQAKTQIFVVRTENAIFPARTDVPASIAKIMDQQGKGVRYDLLAPEAFEDDVGRLARSISVVWQAEARTSERKEPPGVRIQPRQQTSGRLLRDLLKIFVNREVPPVITRRLIPNPFLRDNPSEDLADYRDETPVAPGLPYVEIGNWCDKVVADIDPDIRVTVLPDQFSLASWGPGPGDEIRDSAFAAATAEKPKTFNGPTVRVDDYHWSHTTLHLTLQRALYFDQRRSNLALDYKYRLRNGSVLTLRDLLRHEYGNRLPPIGDRRLANTIGVAALILVRSGGVLSPYILPRSKDVAVFNVGGEWHCTASGVVEAPVGTNVASQFHYDSILKELWEEVGLLPHDLTNLRPVAFCREMNRGGKPQMFFLGVTDLTPEELHEKLVGARAWNRANGQIIENMLMPALRRPSDISDLESRALFYEKGFTPEAAACIHYFDECQRMSGNSLFGRP